ncbi:MAG: 50S ribosomal protein L15 [Pirellulales bacterium]
MNINDVHRSIEKHKKRRRVGRGIGSGRGKTASRGHKGDYSRSGSHVSPIFEGGRMPVIRRIPKRGFNNSFAKILAVVNVGDLEARFAAGDEVTPDALKKNGLAKYPHDQVKILGTGELNKKLSVSAHAFSKSALAKIESAGGKVTVLPGPAPVVKVVKERIRKPAAERSIQERPIQEKPAADQPATDHPAAKKGAEKKPAEGQKKEKTPRKDKKKTDAE